MAHYFIFANKDSYITKNSPQHVVQHSDSRDKNYGNDEILELKKDFVDLYAVEPWNISRILTQFDYSVISSSIHNGKIARPANTNNFTLPHVLSSSFYLRYYEVSGQNELDKSYTLETAPLSQSWDEGTGKHYDNPKTAGGVTWDSGSSSSWSVTPGSNSYSGSANIIGTAKRSGDGGGVWMTGSRYNGSSVQSFSNQSADIEIDVTNIVHDHLSGSIENYGFITKFSGSQEFDTNPINLKFFSRNTNTIYQPKLEVRWNDCSYATPVGANYLTMSGEIENHIFIKGLQPKYREDEWVKFRLGCRKKYVTKTFTESMLTSSFFVPKGSGSYSIVDVSTETPIVPFGAYTSMSADGTGMYFEQNLNTFEPGRYYKVLFKLKYDDGQEHIIDNDEEFKVI